MKRKRPGPSLQRLSDKEIRLLIEQANDEGGSEWVHSIRIGTKLLVSREMWRDMRAQGVTEVEGIPLRLMQVEVTDFLPAIRQAKRSTPSGT